MKSPRTKKSANGKPRAARAGAPRAERPIMPKGYGVPKSATGMVPWETTRDLLSRATSYWLVTIDDDGKPHLVGQWGAWVEDRWYFEGGEDTKWARNVARDGRIAMGAERATAAVMVEGRARHVDRIPIETATKIAAQYARKYGRVYDYRPTPDKWTGGGYVLEPAKVFSWDVRGFPRTVTRYRFG